MVSEHWTKLNFPNASQSTKVRFCSESQGMGQILRTERVGIHGGLGVLKRETMFECSHGQSLLLFSGQVGIMAHQTMHWGK